MHHVEAIALGTARASFYQAESSEYVGHVAHHQRSGGRCLRVIASASNPPSSSERRQFNHYSRPDYRMIFSSMLLSTWIAVLSPKPRDKFRDPFRRQSSAEKH